MLISFLVFPSETFGVRSALGCLPNILDASVKAPMVSRIRRERV